MLARQEQRKRTVDRRPAAASGGFSHAQQKLARLLLVMDVRRRQRATARERESERAVPSLEGLQPAVEVLSTPIGSCVAIDYAGKVRERLPRAAQTRRTPDERTDVLWFRPASRAFYEVLTKRLVEASNGDVGGSTRRTRCVLRGPSFDQLPSRGGEVV